MTDCTPAQARELADKSWDMDRQCVAALRSLADQVEARNADAKRYRWLRSGAYPLGVARTILNNTPYGIDAAIDQAMAGDK